MNASEVLKGFAMKQVYSYLDKAGLECEKIMAEENVELALSYGVKQAPTLVVQGNPPTVYAGVIGIKEFLKQFAR